MKLAFYITAALMIVAALALLLVPLLRQRRGADRPRHVLPLALTLALLLPFSAIALYLDIGTPQALQGVPAMAGAFDDALSQLKQHLEEQPGDLQGWTLLAQVQAKQHQAAAARDAWGKVLSLDAGNLAGMLGWAEADAQLRPDHRLAGQARDLLQRALQQAPNDQRVLFLLGISDYQSGDYAQAIALWQRLMPLLETDSAVAQAVAAQIQEAKAQSKQPKVQSKKSQNSRPSP